MLMRARAVAVLIALSTASAHAEPPPAAQVRDHIVGLAKLSAKNDAIRFRDDLVLELTERGNDQTVYLSFHDALAHCPSADCAAAIDDYFRDNAASIADARALRDKRDAGADGLEEYALDPSGRHTIIARSGANTNQNTAGNMFGRNTIPLGVDAFTEYMRAKLQLYSPYPVVAVTTMYPMTIGQGLGVAVAFPKKTSVIPFNTAHRWCFVIPGACETGVTAFIQARAREFEALHQPEQRNGMFAYLALSDGKGGYRDPAKRRGDAVRPAFGNFVEVCGLSELAVWARERLADPADVDPASPQGRAICEKNTAALIGGMGQAYDAPAAADGIGMAQGDKYEANRLLFPDQWRPLAQRLGGLLVVAPAANAIMFARDGGDATVQALHDRARELRSRSGMEALSATVLRWSGNGWSVALEDDAGI